MAIRSVIDGVKELDEFLAEFPERVQRRVCRLALKKAMKAIVTRAGVLTPRNKSRKPKHAIRLADGFVQKAWNRKGLSLQIGGPQSRKFPHKSIVEAGTKVRVSKKYVHLARDKRGRYSKQGMIQFKRRSNHPPGYRGRMPAFHPLGKAFASMQDIAERIIEGEVRAGLDRAVARQGD